MHKNNTLLIKSMSFALSIFFTSHRRASTFNITSFITGTFTSSALLLAGATLSWAHAADTSLSATPTISIYVSDANGEPVKDMVLTLTPNFTLASTPQREEEPAIMNQIDKQFAPHVLVVQSGTDISFPNADNLFHHVYSFSPTKQFELKLYKEFTAEPLRFEQAGIVDIGCNIHDWMLGYIVVTDSPFFAKTNEEGVMNVSLPVGEYSVMTWHPQQPDVKLFNSATLHITNSQEYKFVLDAVFSDDDFDEGFGDY